MRAFAVKSSDMAPSPDNPAGRWDVGFHALRLAAVRLANGIADNSNAFDERAFLALARGDRERAKLKSAIQNADSKEAVYAVLLNEMKLTNPRPELKFGLEEIARRLAHENALRLTREAAELLKRAQALKN